MALRRSMLHDDNAYPGTARGVDQSFRTETDFVLGSRKQMAPPMYFRPSPPQTHCHSFDSAQRMNLPLFDVRHPRGTKPPGNRP